MKKAIICITICTMIPFSMVACSTQQSEQSAQSAQQQTENNNPLDTINMPYFSENESNAIDMDKLPYDIQKAHFLIGTEQSNRVELYYPQLEYNIAENTPESDITQQICDGFTKSELLKQAGMSYYMEQTANISEIDMYTKPVFFHANYRVQTANQKIISVLYQQAFSHVGNTADYSMTGATLSIAENRLLKLNEMITDMDKLLTLLETDQFTPIPYFENETIPFSELLKTMPYMREELLEIFKNNNKRALVTEGEQNAHVLWQDRVFEWYLWDNKLVIMYVGNDFFNQYAIELYKIRDIVSDTFYQNYIVI